MKVCRYQGASEDVPFSKQAADTVGINFDGICNKQMQDEAALPGVNIKQYLRNVLSIAQTK
jgi:hypothetical protein